MDHRSSIQFVQSLSSLYTGPLAFNFAGNGDEGDGTEEGDKSAEGEAAPEGEGAAAAEKPEGGEGEEDDPLKTPNPFDEGSAQHDAFERQREKYRTMLEEAKATARKDGEQSLSGKFDQLIDLLKANPRTETKVTPTKEEPTLTEEQRLQRESDKQVVAEALKGMGIDPVLLAQMNPQELVEERRRKIVTDALAKLHSDNPTVEFDDVELVTFINDQGISQMQIPIVEMLELGFYRKNKGTLGKAPAAKVDAPAASARKEGVPIAKSGTKSTPAAPEKPKTVAGYKQRILAKLTGK